MLSKYYLQIAASYGALRKAAQLHDVHVLDKDLEKPSIRPMLVTTKLGLCALAGIISVYMWPYYIYNDVADLEKRYRGYKRYKKDANVIHCEADMLFK